jgi:hypothetical protein
MTTATVSAAWDSAIFQHEDILAITEAIFPYEVTITSEAEIAAVSFEQKINFVEYTVSRAIGAQELGAPGSAQCTFDVDIRYTLQKLLEGEAIDGSAYDQVGDFFDTLISLVYSELGVTWSGTVDFYNHQEGPPQISDDTIAGVSCWRGVYKLTGTQFTTL